MSNRLVKAAELVGAPSASEVRTSVSDESPVTVPVAVDPVDVVASAPPVPVSVAVQLAPAGSPVKRNESPAPIVATIGVVAE